MLKKVLVKNYEIIEKPFQTDVTAMPRCWLDKWVLHTTWHQFQFRDQLLKWDMLINKYIIYEKEIYILGHIQLPDTMAG